MKTLKEILQEGESNHTHYLRSYDYIRREGLTMAAEELEKRGAVILSATIHPIENRDYPEDKVVALDTWVKILFENKIYYFQFDDNMFFGAYWTRSERSADGKTKRSLYGKSEPAVGIYDDCDYTDAKGTSEYRRAATKAFARNVVREFEKIRLTQFTASNSYTKEIPSYEREIKQVIYNHGAL